MSPAEALVFAVAADWAICWSLLYLSTRPRQKPVFASSPANAQQFQALLPVQRGPTPAEQELLRQMVPPTPYRRSESVGYGDGLGHGVWIDPKKYPNWRDYMIAKVHAQAGLPVPAPSNGNDWANQERVRVALIQANPVLADRMERAS
jgi:hypothetical protein